MVSMLDEQERSATRDGSQSMRSEGSAAGGETGPRHGRPAEADPASPHRGRGVGRLTVSWARRAYWKVGLIGLVLYLAAMKLLAASGNPNLVPTVIVLGAFLVPVTYVVFLHDNETFTRISPSVVALAFFFGGVLGTFGAQLLEEQLVVGRGILAMLAVGFSEEVAKLAAIAWLLWRKEYRSEMHGIIFGAAAGMGFAAFETMGYGFTYLLASRGNLDVLGQVLLNRAMLAPLGHGTWAAIVAGVIWRERREGRLRLNGSVLRVCLGVVTLHALWDWTALAIPLGLDVPIPMLHWRFVDLMVPELWLPLPALVIGLLGLWILSRLMREASRSEVSHA